MARKFRMKATAANHSMSGGSAHKRANPIRILTAVPICDGHDSAIITINLELVRHGIEVIYLGYHRSVRDIVRAAIQENVQAIGLSSYNGGHVEFFTEVLVGLKRAGSAVFVFTIAVECRIPWLATSETRRSHLAPVP